MDRQVAVALGYRPGSDLAPRVLASGRGPVAARILESALRHGIPVEQQGDLAQLLAQIPLGEEIPSDLYPAVAEVFAFLLRIAERHTGTLGSRVGSTVGSVAADGGPHRAAAHEHALDARQVAAVDQDRQ